MNLRALAIPLLVATICFSSLDGAPVDPERTLEAGIIGAVGEAGKDSQKIGELGKIEEFPKVDSQLSAAQTQTKKIEEGEYLRDEHQINQKTPPVAHKNASPEKSEPFKESPADQKDEKNDPHVMTLSESVEESEKPVEKGGSSQSPEKAPSGTEEGSQKPSEKESEEKPKEPESKDPAAVRLSEDKQESDKVSGQEKPAEDKESKKGSSEAEKKGIANHPADDSPNKNVDEGNKGEGSSKEVPKNASDSSAKKSPLHRLGKWFVNIYRTYSPKVQEAAKAAWAKTKAFFSKLKPSQKKAGSANQAKKTKSCCGGH